MNWTGNRPSRDSAAYSGRELGRVIISFCHFDGNHGDALVFQPRSTGPSLFERCNFIINWAVSLLAVSNATHIRDSIFVRNKAASVVAFVPGSVATAAAQVVGCYADEWGTIQRGVKIADVWKFDTEMTLIRMPRTTGDNYVFDTESPILHPWIFGALGVLTVVGGWEIQRKCSREGSKR
jgi:hypothetical protein